MSFAYFGANGDRLARADGQVLATRGAEASRPRKQSR